MQGWPRHAPPMMITSCRSLRQLFAGLLRYHVGGIPIGPVCVALTGALFVFAVGSFRTAKCACQIARRRESRRPRIDATGQPRRNLLQQPAVAVWVSERDMRLIAAMLGVRTHDPESAK